jgi:hypothetical protein
MSGRSSLESWVSPRSRILHDRVVTLVLQVAEPGREEIVQLFLEPGIDAAGSG